MKICVAITGGSGVSLGKKLFDVLGGEKYLIISESAKLVSQKEEGTFLNSDISAPPASGSFGMDAMIIAPCSTNTLAKIANGIADNLITRSASVMIKEQKKLILAVRETPLSAITLENMLKLSRLNVIIAPPIFAQYSAPKTISDLEDFFIGKWLDLLGIENSLYKRWNT